jgi:DNA-binding CsgD family transcriptional regulator/PAS domain-containing protein
MDRRDVLLKLTERLLAAPGSQEGWQTFVLDLCNALRGSAANLISHDLLSHTAAVAVTARTDSEALRLYSEHWYVADPWARSPILNSFRSGDVAIGDQLIPHSEMRRTAFYNDFAHHYDIARCLVGIVESGGDMLSGLSINRGEKHHAFNDDDAQLLHALMGPLQRALELHRRLGAAELFAADISSVLDRLPVGVLFLSASRCIQFLNRPAEEILRSKDGLTIEQGELRAASMTGTTRLRTVIRNAALISAGGLIHGATAVALERPSGKQPLSVLAAPLPRPRMGSGIESAVVAVFVTDPDRKPRAEAATLRIMFGLTPAEAQLVLVLLEGVSVKEAAERLELASDTVRKRLKSIYQKTDTHRQSDLMRRVLLSTLPRTV